MGNNKMIMFARRRRQRFSLLRLEARGRRENNGEDKFNSIVLNFTPHIELEKRALMVKLSLCLLEKKIGEPG